MYTDDSILTFGKYKFTKLCRVPADYLLKFVVETSIPELHEYVVNNLERIVQRSEGIIEPPPLTFPCEKAAYINEKIAKIVLNRIKAIQQDYKKPVRVYECDRCGMWHLTSVPLEIYQQLKTA